MNGAGQLLMALTVASALAWRGLKKRSLTVHGAVAAFVVGLVSFTSSMRSGMLLIAFYQSGSTFTKFKAHQKATLDASSDDASSGRGVSQVLACSLLATLLSLASLINFGVGADCVCSCSAEPLQSAILCGIIGHYACCAADTWASELGILDPKVRLITNPLIMVPPGTNGGVSLTGIAASLGGGVFIGSIAWFLGPPGETPGIVLLGAGAGLGGSLLDSLLGATCQVTRYDDTRRLVVREGGRVVCGRDFLSNVQVNVVSVALTTALAATLGPRLLC